jgi:uncharacterized RDD family membrane protein YckC
MIQARPAGFWIRALAAGIDFVVLFVVQLSFAVIGARLSGGDVDGAASRPLATFFTVVFAGVYTTVLHSLAGQTIGKMFVGVRVVAGDGPPPFGAALLRFGAYFVSAAPVMLGFVMAGLRRDKRALHDLIAGTQVERQIASEPEAAPPVEPPSDPAAAGVV